jgi:glycerol-1-phosphate dehydrogenase [NAD(P)+]
MDYAKYLNKEISCSCGRKHNFPCEHIIIAENALSQVPALIAAGGYRRLLLVQDDNTRIAAGRQLEEIFTAAGYIAISGENYPATDNDSTCYFCPVTLDAQDLKPDEHGIGSVLTHLPPGCDLILAVGSGTVNDICRFVSFKLQIPYFVIATAPSMDGYTSNVAPMITNHVKKTYIAHIPKAVISEPDILAAVSMELISAGVGDILGKYVALVDWRLTNLLTDEYYCPEVAALIGESIEKVRAAVSELKKLSNHNAEVASTGNIDAGFKAALVTLMDALILAGIAMSYVGNSRPAAGTEHHLAQYWEMLFLMKGEHPALHGTKVGVGTIVAMDLFRRLLAIEPDFAALKNYRFDEAVWEKDIKVKYGSAAPAVIALEAELKKNDTAEVVARIERMALCWDEMKEIIGTLPATCEVRDLLADLQAPVDPQDIGIDEEMLRDSIKYGKESRDKFGLLQILYDLQVESL